jgi:manganese/zinc/iron transport system permease protein
LFKEFRLVCFDPEFAETEGWPVSRIDLFLMTLVVVVTVVGLQSVGMILIVAMLIVPAAAARFWTEQLSVMVLLSAVFGGLSGYFGAAASTLLPRLPAGAVIVLTAGLVFSISFLLAPNRGVLAVLFRTFCLRLRISEEHLLRGVFEAVERLDTPQAPVPVRSLSIGRSWSRGMMLLTFLRLRAQGFISGLDVSSILLTASGRTKASAITRNHRLWEEYLLLYGNVDTAHVDYSADLVEHVLSPEIVAELEILVSEKTALPEDLQSVHPIEGVQ